MGLPRFCWQGRRLSGGLLMPFKSLKEKVAKLKSWQWFLLLYGVGFIAVLTASYGIKLLMTGLP
jgi:hypothetical protein